MKYIVTPESKKDYSYCPALGNCNNYAVCKKCPALGNGNPCPQENACGTEYVTLCALCSEDPKFCGGDDLLQLQYKNNRN